MSENPSPPSDVELTPLLRAELTLAAGKMFDICDVLDEDVEKMEDFMQTCNYIIALSRARNTTSAELFGAFQACTNELANLPARFRSEIESILEGHPFNVLKDIVTRERDALSLQKNQIDTLSSRSTIRTLIPIRHIQHEVDDRLRALSERLEKDEEISLSRKEQKN